jgi:hypothetical protein
MAKKVAGDQNDVIATGQVQPNQPTSLPTRSCNNHWLRLFFAAVQH